MKLLLLWIFSLAISQRVLAAACCGGGFASPSIISGDDKAQLTGSFLYSQTHTEVDTKGVWKKKKPTEHSQSFTLDASHIFMDRWQAGLNIPIIKKHQSNSNSSGLGDVTTLLGYEYLPDWSYHPYRPKGIGFLQVVLPSGKSVYESQSHYGLDIRGRGFWTLGIGTLLTKTFNKYDVLLKTDIHRSFQKKININGVHGTLHPGWGGQLDIGFGYNLESFRFGSNISWNYEEAVAFKGAVSSSGNLQKFTALSLSVSYLAKEDLAFTTSYSDSTIIKSPFNTSLNRSIMLSLQKRWPR